MADEVFESSGEDTAGETRGEQLSASDAQAESAVSEKMESIFGAGREQQEADEREQEGLTSPDEPDGVDATAANAADATAGDDGKVSYEDATLDDLKAAEKEAASTGDYEKAMELRNQIKANETQSVAPKGAKDGFDPNLKAIAKELGGWSQTDIDEFVKASPTLAKLTFQKIADSYNQVSMQYAQAARNGAQALTQPQQQNASPQTQQQSAKLDELYKDLAGFSDVAGSELVERFIKPLKNEVIEPLRDALKFVDQLRAEKVRDEILAGFKAITVGGYEDHYGGDTGLDDKQRNNRQQVANVADLIYAGAEKQHVPMKYGEAIRRAHLIVNADQMKRQARTQLVSEVKKRSTQITSRPSQRIARQSGNTDTAAMGAVSQFWDSRE